MYILRLKRKRTKRKRNRSLQLNEKPFKAVEQDHFTRCKGIRTPIKFLSCEITNLGNLSCGTGIQVPLTPESSTWNLESRRGIQDPRLGYPYMGRTSKTKLDMELNRELCDDRTTTNMPLPSSKNPHFRNEAKCTTFLVKMSFIYIRMENHFHIKG